MVVYFAALDPMTLVRALPGNVAQGIIWGIMALGVYIIGTTAIAVIEPDNIGFTLHFVYLTLQI